MPLFKNFCFKRNAKERHVGNYKLKLGGGPKTVEE